ncbi:MAG: DUF488 domain-containing protein [Candidatus Aenigmatarchaeota archaeon]
MKIFTIGHSTRSFGEFLKILKHFKIDLLIDVRKFPSSKKFPWFNKENLEIELRRNKIDYLHYPELGGFRKEGYEAFTKTSEFADAIKKLMEIIDYKNVVITCAELLFFRCHRRYIAEALTALGYKVIHIYDENKVQEHKLKMPEMQVKIFCDKIKH